MSDNRGFGMKKFLIWDSATNTPIRNIQPIDVELSGNLILTKKLDLSFFDDAVYPVYTDTTTTFNPDADAESTSVDGWARQLYSA